MLGDSETVTEPNIMQSADIKQAAHQLIDQYEHLTWADLAYQATLKASIEQGLKEAKAGELMTQEEVEKEFGLNE